MTYDIDRLARDLGFRPTDQQLEAITADLRDPMLVVAGAGSGKTAIMAARVMWAVGTGAVDAGEVLGLTFTVKAAGELGQRMRDGLAGPLRDAARSREVVGEPSVDTYHSFARQLVLEHGLRIGVEPDSRMISEIEVAHLAHQVTVRSRRRLSEVARRPIDVSARLRALDKRLAEHSVTPDQLSADAEAFITDVDAIGNRPGEMGKARTIARARIELAHLVDEFRVAKARSAVLDFADLMRLADDLVSAHPDVGALVRERYGLVLLDEYQDTSFVQTKILAALFGGGHPVTAVGDPLQGIYGWRGASEASITTFPTQFVRADGRDAAVHTLSISQRSVPGVLAAANRIASDLSRRHPTSCPLEAAARFAETSSAAERAVPTVIAALLKEHADELAWVADQVQLELDRGTRPDQVAVLCRTNGGTLDVASALGEREIRVQVSSSGSLLEHPAALDVINVLQAAFDPLDNPAVARLLRRPRWRIGDRDLAVLGRRAADLARGPTPRQGADSTGRPRYRASLVDAVRGVDAVDLPSLAEAVARPGAEDSYRYSAEARARLAEFRAELDAVRALHGLPLPEIVADVISRVGLDVEVEVEKRRGGSGAIVKVAGLRRLLALADEQAAKDPAAGVSGFLAWLRAVEHLGTDVEVEPIREPDAVQVLTAHAAKGLEWDVVVVAGLAAGAFPVGRASSTWLTDPTEVPNALRGDRQVLPALSEVSSRAGKAFREEARFQKDLDERQLAYVAVTRARKRLRVSGHWWGPTQRTKRGPSPFLRDVAEGLTDECRDPWCPPPLEDTRPVATGAEPNEPGSPADTGGWQGDDARAANALVALSAGPGPAGEAECPDEPTDGERPDEGQSKDGSADDGLTDEERARVESWRRVATRLLGAPASSPDRLKANRPKIWSASSTMALIHDPSEFAASIRRPMPQQPRRSTQVGIAFHRWVEDFYARAPLLPDLDDEGSERPMGPGLSAELGLLRDGFARCGYDSRQPVEVEWPFSVVLAGRVFTGRIDAVFAEGDGFEVVDWKTNSEKTADPLQLAVYRIAWSRYKGIDPSSVTGAFAYVRLSEVERWSTLPAADELSERLERAWAEADNWAGGVP